MYIETYVLKLDMITTNGNKEGITVLYALDGVDTMDVSYKNVFVL